MTEVITQERFQELGRMLVFLEHTGKYRIAFKYAWEGMHIDRILYHNENFIGKLCYRAPDSYFYTEIENDYHNESFVGRLCGASGK